MLRTAARTEPVELVLRRDEATPEMKRLVVEARVVERLVEVALVEVELTAVKFWRVVEALTNRSPMTSSSAPTVVVAMPPITTDVAELGYMVRPLLEVANLSLLDPPPPVASVPQNMIPPVVDLTSQLAELRLRTAKEVLVALVEVELTIIRLVMVEVALLASIPPVRVERPETVREVRVPIEVKLERVVTEELI